MDDKEKKNPNHNIKRPINWLSISTLAVLALIFLLSVLPALKPFRKTLWFFLIDYTLFSALLGLIIFNSRNKKPIKLDGIIIYILTVLTLFGSLFFKSFRLRILVASILPLVFLSYAAFRLLFSRSSNVTSPVCCGLGSLLIALILFADDEIKYLSDYFYFWLPSLIVSLVFGSLFLYLIIAHQELFPSLKETKSPLGVKGLIAFYSLFAYTVFFFGGWAYASSWNFAFDNSTPTEEIFTIKDKDTRYVYRGGTSYYFVLEKNQQKTVRMGVSLDTYTSYQIGDAYTLKIYQGAFNAPYYTSF
ncbi:MAG: hypothetical protein LKJ88_01970 [Bacilli bacterium]|jgi:hypothetical protein|nr:hypothetical protein [Bacilli bacterium]